MGVFSERALAFAEVDLEKKTKDNEKLSALAVAEQREALRQQAEEDAAKAALSQLNDADDDEESDCVSDDEDDDTAPDDECNSKPQQKLSDDEKRKAHEESEAKRKAEWEAKRQAREDAETAAWESAVAMDDNKVMAASMKRVGTDSERLTRRNMKQCVTEHIQTKCLDDAAFARQVMHPRKNMLNCFRYINRKAREFVEQEMKDNDEKPLNGVYGSDVPDDLCYQWAEEYFLDMDAVEDKKDEEKFVPKSFSGASSKGKKKPEKKKPEPKKQTPTPGLIKDDNLSGQMSMLGADIGVSA